MACYKKNEILKIISKKVIICIILIGLIADFLGNKVQGKAFSTQSQAVSVALPENINFYLNPEKKYGQDYIYSPRYKIRNMGKERIVFDMEMTLSELVSNTGIVYCSRESEIQQETKSIYLCMLLEHAQEQELYVLSKGKCGIGQRIILEPYGSEGDTLYISFAGKLAKNADWQSGEMGIDVFYLIDEVKEINQNEDADGTGEMDKAHGTEEINVVNETNGDGEMDAVSETNGDREMDASEGINKAKDIYKLILEGTHIYWDSMQEEIPGGVQSKLTLKPEEGYSLPSEIKVFMNGEAISSYEYDSLSGMIMLDEVMGDITIFANGISVAELPEETVFSSDKEIWEWSVAEGIEAYEYKFLQNEVIVKKGRIAADKQILRWKWDEGLDEGKYQMKIKAIGDNAYYMNSEEKIYWLTVVN